MSSTALWFLRLLVVVALPFAIVLGSHAAAMQFPGTVRLAVWEWFASSVFLTMLAPAFLALRQPILFLPVRIVVGILVALLFSFCALVIHVHATCEYTPPYIGGMPQLEGQWVSTQSPSAGLKSQEGGC